MFGNAFLLLCINLYISGCDRPFTLQNFTVIGRISWAFEEQGPHVNTQFVLGIMSTSLSMVYVKHIHSKSNYIAVANTAIIYNAARQ